PRHAAAFDVRIEIGASDLVDQETVGHVARVDDEMSARVLPAVGATDDPHIGIEGMGEIDGRGATGVVAVDAALRENGSNMVCVGGGAWRQSIATRGGAAASRNAHECPSEPNVPEEIHDFW